MSQKIIISSANKSVRIIEQKKRSQKAMSQTQDLPELPETCLEHTEPKLPPPNQLQFTLPNPSIMNESNLVITHEALEPPMLPYFQNNTTAAIIQGQIQPNEGRTGPPLQQQDNPQLQNLPHQHQTNPVLKIMLVISIAGFLFFATIGTYVSLLESTQASTNNEGNFGDGTDDDTEDNTDDDTNDQNQNNNLKPPTFDEICANYVFLCSNLSQSVKQLTLSNFSSTDQIMSLLQLSHSFTLIENSPNSTLSKAEFLKMAQNITSSIECLKHYLPNNYTSIYQKVLELQIDNQKEFERYLNMTVAFNSRAYAIKREAELPESCIFPPFNKQVTQNAQADQIYEVGPKVTEEALKNCSQSQFLLYFTGYGISPIGVVRNLDKLNKTLAFHEDSRIKNRIIALGASKHPEAYNSKSLLEMYEVGKQNVISFSNKTIQEINAFRAFMRLINAFYSLEGLEDVTPEIFGLMQIGFERELAKSFNNESTYGSPNSQYQFNEHIQLVNQLIKQGREVIMFAYASAAVYAYNIYRGIEWQDNQAYINNNYANFYNAVKLVSIAPLANIMPDASESYVTVPNDGVVAGIQKGYVAYQGVPYPLLANSFAKQFSDVSMNHSLEGYLDKCRDKILWLVINARLKANNTAASYGRGLLSVQLIWKNFQYSTSHTQNLDLHVFEPNDSHVYYLINSSENGKLDRQSKNYPQVEHYHSYCDIKEGNYTVKVNLFSGYFMYYFSWYIYVTLVSGDSIFISAFDIKNSTSLGEAGNDNPNFNICTINVKMNNQTGKYQTKIYDTFSIN